MVMDLFKKLLGSGSRPGEERRLPSLHRVLARARVLASVFGRATLEREVAEGEFPARENERVRRRVLRWLKTSGLNRELELKEYNFLSTPVGRACEQDVIDAEWRSEGLAILIWALQRFELPRYDAISTGNLPLERIGFLSSAAERDLSEPPLLRSASEIDRFRSHITIVRWRLTQFGASRDSDLYQCASQQFPGRSGVEEPMDFVGYLRQHPSFKEYWLDGLRFVDGDLAVGDRSIATAPGAEVKKCMSIATERQIAACWLLGDDEIYTNVNLATLLSAC